MLPDRFLEAVWREALWPDQDGIATNRRKFDDAIRFGFGLRLGADGFVRNLTASAGVKAGMAQLHRTVRPACNGPDQINGMCLN